MPKALPRRLSARFSISFDEQTAAQLASLAADNECSTASLVRVAIAQYLREDSIKAELADFEARQGGSFKRIINDIRRVDEAQQFTLALLDKFLLTYLGHTDVVPDAKQEVAQLEAQRRYDAIMKLAMLEVQHKDGTLAALDPLTSKIASD